MERLKLKDIAKLAGVSPATVSNVLNDKGGVSDATRRVIEDLLTQNGYSKKTKEANGRKDAENCIRFLKYIHRPNNLLNSSYIVEVVYALEKFFRSNSFEMTVSTFGDGERQQIRRLLMDNPKNGVILLGTDLTEGETLDYLDDCPVPVVVVSNLVPTLPYSAVSVDTDLVMDELVSLLVAAGHKSFGYFTYREDTFASSSRIESLKKALHRRGIAFDESMIYRVIPPGREADVVYRNVSEFLNSGKKLPSAVIAHSDDCAYAIYMACQTYGIRVPQNLSLICFGPRNYCRMLSGMLASVDLRPSDIATMSGRLLLGHVQEPDSPVMKMLVRADILSPEVIAEYDPNSTCSYVL